MILSGLMLIVPVSKDSFIRLQKRGARIILRKKIREDRTANLYCELGWVSCLNVGTLCRSVVLYLNAFMEFIHPI